MTDASDTRLGYNYEPPRELSRLDGMGSAPDYDPTAFADGAGWPLAGTRPRIEDADSVPVNAAQLGDALSTASAGDLIFIPRWASINVDTLSETVVTANDVTLASDRGPDSEGGELHIVDTSWASTTPRNVFRVEGAGFRLTGLRLTGVHLEHGDWVGYSTDQPTCCFEINGDNAEVDNVVGRGWGHSPFRFGTDSVALKPHVHHCDLVDNPQDALGYGTSVGQGDALIQKCYFDNNRHAIAGSGDLECAYTVRECVFGPRGILHQVDVHADGGKRFSVHHNAFLFTENRVDGSLQEAVKFRDVPSNGAEVIGNVLAHPPARYDETDTGANGDAVLLTTPTGVTQPATMQDAGIEVRTNVATDEPLQAALGPAGWVL